MVDKAKIEQAVEEFGRSGVLTQPAGFTDFSAAMFVADADAPGTYDAMRWHYGQVGDGADGLRDLTDDECVIAHGQGCLAGLEDIYSRYMHQKTRAETPVDDQITTAPPV